MLPHREWSGFELVTLLRQGPDDLLIEDWTTEHLLYGLQNEMGLMGNSTPEANIYQAYHPVFKPKDSDFGLVASLDQALDYGFWYTAALGDNSRGETSGSIVPYTLADPNTVDYGLVNGKYYDGIVGHAWGAYPPGAGHNYYETHVLTIANLPVSGVNWIAAYDAGTSRGNSEAVMFFKNGLYLHMVNWVPHGEPFPVGEACLFWFYPQKVRVNYLNAVVNSLSRRSMPVAGGVPLVLTGLGFDQDDAELSSKTRNPGNDPHNWLSLVDFIDFIGLQGQGTTTLTGGGVDFTVDSDTQITIPSMPALAYGTYSIRLEKRNAGIAAPDDVYSYVGDWGCSATGLCTAGARMRFFAGGEEQPPQGPFVLTNWQLKNKLDLSFVDRSYAPKDVCCTDKFYDGRLQEVSGLQRAINDVTGLFISSDMTAKLVNVDKEFSKLLAEYYFKNEPIEMYLAFKGHPESWKTQFFRGFVEDHSLKGGEFNVDIRDLTTVFFQRKVPFYRVTREEYPNAHDSAVGRPMPEAIGQLSYIATEASGAMEALYVDTANYKYLAARASLHAVPQVYADGELKTLTTHYTISYEDGGRTMITFTSDQGDKKITYNCEGYMYEDWNSADGYVQHPVYVFLFYLALLVGVPINYLDFVSFEEVRIILDNLDSGIATSGYLGLMEEQDAMGVVKELCQTIGGAFYPDRLGRLKLAMKDISNITTTKFIFSGIDTMEPPQQDWNLKEARNRVKVRWNYIPAAARYLESKEDERTDAIKALSGNRQEAKQPLDMKWTTSETLADKQIFNLLYKLGKGYKRTKIKLPLTFIDFLDIYDSFRLQDPYGVSLDGSGDYGRYLLVEKVGYDWQGSSMDIDALDLTYILRRYLVLGDEDNLPQNWNVTTEESKAFAYLCDEVTGLFADLEAGKILVDENKIAM